MDSGQKEDDGGGRATESVDDSQAAEQLRPDLKVTSIRELSEVVGKLIVINRNGMAVIEATRRFEVPVEGKTARSMRAAVGKEVAVLCIDGKTTRWRLAGVCPAKRARMSESGA